MTVIDTIDYAKPMPGGSRKLLDTAVNLSTVGGVYNSPALDVSVFSGVLIEWTALDNAGDFGTLQAIFKGSLGAQGIKPVHSSTWRGDKTGAVNVPVMGAVLNLTITGPAHNVNSVLTVTGHGAGESCGVRLASDVIASREIFSVGAGTSFTDDVPTIYEGPATLTADMDAGTCFLQVRSYDPAGLFRSLAILRLQPAVAQTVPLWIPPAPLQVFGSKAGGDPVGNIRYGLTLHRP